MARNQKSDRIARRRAADRARRAGLAERARERCVVGGLPRRDSQQRAPDLDLKVRPARGERRLLAREYRGRDALRARVVARKIGARPFAADFELRLFAPRARRRSRAKSATRKRRVASPPPPRARKESPPRPKKSNPNRETRPASSRRERRARRARAIRPKIRRRARRRAFFRRPPNGALILRRASSWRIETAARPPNGEKRGRNKTATNGRGRRFAPASARARRWRRDKRWRRRCVRNRGRRGDNRGDSFAAKCIRNAPLPQPESCPFFAPANQRQQP